MNNQGDTVTGMRLRIWQQNLGKSSKAQFNLINSNSLHKNYDLLLLQEPHIDGFGNTKVTRAWHVVYPATREGERIRSVILVNKQLDTNTWTQLPILGIQDITAIKIEDEFGRLSIFNIYNDCTHSRSLNVLRSFLTVNR